MFGVCNKAFYLNCEKRKVHQMLATYSMYQLLVNCTSKHNRCTSPITWNSFVTMLTHLQTLFFSSVMSHKTSIFIVFLSLHNFFLIASVLLLLLSLSLPTSKKWIKLAIFIWKYILCMQTYVSVTNLFFFCELRRGGNMNLTRFYSVFRITLHLIWVRRDGKKKNEQLIRNEQWFSSFFPMCSHLDQ